MTTEDRERVLLLCQVIRDEYDPERFSQCLDELNNLLDRINVEWSETSERTEVEVSPLTR